MLKSASAGIRPKLRLTDGTVYGVGLGTPTITIEVGEPKASTVAIVLVKGKLPPITYIVTRESVVDGVVDDVVSNRISMHQSFARKRLLTDVVVLEGVLSVV